MSKFRHAFLLILFILFGLIVVKISAVIGSVFEPVTQNVFSLYMLAVATNLLAAILIGTLNFVFAKFISKERFGDIGWDLSSSSIRLFFAGTAFISVVAILVGIISIFLLDISFHLKIPFNKAVGLILLYVVGTLFQCTVEELWMRSWFISNFARLTGKNIAIMATGATFGLLHLLNSNYSWLGLLNATFAGIMLSAAFIKTRSIWLPIGLHFGWNLMLGLMFNNQIFQLLSPSLAKISLFSAVEDTWWGITAVVLSMLFVISKLSNKIFDRHKHEINTINSAS